MKSGLNSKTIFVYYNSRKEGSTFTANFPTKEVSGLLPLVNSQTFLIFFADEQPLAQEILAKRPFLPNCTWTLKLKKS